MQRLLNRYTLLGLLLVFAGLMLSNIVVLKLLGIDNSFSWLAIFSVIKAKLWLEASLALVIAFLPIAVIACYYRGGLTRILTYYSISTLSLVVICFALGVIAFQLVNKESLIMPFDIIRYIDELSQSPNELKHFKSFEFGAFFLLFGLIIYFGYEKLGAKGNALGDAHFANGLEVKKANFLTKNDESIIIGKKYGVPLSANGFEHVLVFAPTGSGKTSGIGIPNLFNYPNSVVCNDVKLSMFETTSGYRESVLGHKCYCWAPANDSAKTHRFNPLSFISDDKFKRIKDIQRIAHILMPDPKGETSFWAKASRKLFMALLLYLLDTPNKSATLGEINRLIKMDSFDKWLLDLLNETEHLAPDFYRNGFSYINNHDKTRSTILEQFAGYFELFDDPIVDAATSATDFDIRNLRREKMTIYIGFTDDDMERLSPLLTLFWQQTISAMIQKVPNPTEEPYPVLCLIDEFSSLGRIERLRRSLKLLREYRVRCVLMFQYIAQTYEQYSHDEARAFTNIKTKIAFSADDINDAEFISKIMGTRTKKVHSGSVSNQSRGMSDSKSYSYQAIPLMRPDKIMKLSTSTALIMRTGHAPVKASQYTWFKQSSMKHLSMPQVKVPRQKVAITPFDHIAKKERLEQARAEQQSMNTKQASKSPEPADELFDV